MLKAVGKESKFENGMRVTDDETIDIVQMVLAGKVNKNLGQLMEKHGGNAIGRCGLDGLSLIHIYYRSFSSDAASTSRCVDTVVKASKEKKLGTVLKLSLIHISGREERWFLSLLPDCFARHLSTVLAGCQKIGRAHV